MSTNISPAVCNTSYERVVRIRQDAGRDNVFDLTVDGTHCFFADGILVHNCHHASARSYRRILAHLEPSPLILGVTATPARSDGKPLGTVWEEIVYQKGILEMIQAGYLVDVRGIRVGLQALDLDRVKSSGGDFQDEALGDALEAAFLDACCAHLDAPKAVFRVCRSVFSGRRSVRGGLTVVCHA